MLVHGHKLRFVASNLSPNLRDSSHVSLNIKPNLMYLPSAGTTASLPSCPVFHDSIRQIDNMVLISHWSTWQRSILLRKLANVLAVQTKCRPVSYPAHRDAFCLSVIYYKCVMYLYDWTHLLMVFLICFGMKLAPRTPRYYQLLT